MRRRMVNRRVPRIGRPMSRRNFLKMSGAGIAGAALMGTAACGGGGGGEGEGPVTLTFSFGPDESGTMTELISQFNQQNEGRIQVEFREMPAATDQYFDQLRTEFQAGGGDIDVIGGDVIWPAQFAANGWILDLSDRFTNTGDFLEGTIQSNSYEGGVYGVPWFTDAGMLYYRADLLEEAGLEPPTTWDELKEQARQVAEEAGIQFGFVFQGAEYEGGVVNGLEYIWTAGGDALDPDDPSVVTIGQPEGAEGLSIWRSMIDDGIAPQAVSTYQEMDAHTAFLNGDAVFMRNWPYVYALAAEGGEFSVTQEQIGIAPLPVAEEGDQSFSCLGGWNFYINAATESPDEAYEFIEFMTAPEQQRYRALEGTFLPTLNELYEDQEILDNVPVIELGAEAIQNVRSRPVSPFYSDMSLVMARQFNAVLSGDTQPEQAAETLQGELENIIQQAGG